MKKLRHIWGSGHYCDEYAYFSSRVCHLGNATHAVVQPPRTMNSEPGQDSKVQRLADESWAILDVEFIKTSPKHRCIRKLYILTENGFDMEMEFYPCKRYRDLMLKYRRSFQFCHRHIHKLNYIPCGISAPCIRALPMLNEFIVDNDITLVLYKGGTIERDLCRELDVDCVNIECFEGIEKAYSHDPREEVNFYYNQLIKI